MGINKTIHCLNYIIGQTEGANKETEEMVVQTLYNTVPTRWCTKANFYTPVDTSHL